MQDSSDTVPKPLYFTFGNHMHWVDFEWLWGAGVLEDSLADMLRLMDGAGVRGNLNFDGIGYEKLAAESPRALELLKRAVEEGRIEVVGASYGQPYGLFHGGESNIRQRVHGVRAVKRLLGVRPRAFWEEEFDFYPQLPQMLKGCGFTCAALFFQWTWHTPTFPEEESPLIHWEGIDGTRLPALAKTGFCLHQWPEDFDGRLEPERIAGREQVVLVQWLELMPSPDWMCRSELLLPKLNHLLEDPRFDLRPRTLSELVKELDQGEAVVRRYGMDDVFHGMSLSKNADRMVRLSLGTERLLLSAESAAALCGLCGRPYPSWDVYPTWELEEAWRETLAAQHHDNHECEALCGFVGKHQFAKANSLASLVLERTLALLERRAAGLDGRLIFNPLGWERPVVVEFPCRHAAVVQVPALGYQVVRDNDRDLRRADGATARAQHEAVTLELADLWVEIDRKRGVIRQLKSAAFPDGALDPKHPLLSLAMKHGGLEDRFETAEVELDGSVVTLRRTGRDGASLVFDLELLPYPPRLEIRCVEAFLPRPDPGMHAGLRTEIAPALENPTLLHDTPYAISEIRAEHDHQRKYPSGDWMTSPQWFETVRRPFTAQSLLDIVAGDRGLLLIHDGGQAFFRTDAGVENLLHMYDPWDEEYCDGNLAGARLIFIPHGPLSHLQRAKLSAEARVPAIIGAGGASGQNPDLPPRFGLFRLEGPGMITAAYRERERSSALFDGCFARGIRDPFVVRIVEFDGTGGPVTLHLKGTGSAARTNLLGEVVELLSPEPEEPGPTAGEPPGSRVRFLLAPHEIATVMLDLEMGRQIPRNLDQYRSVWATIHKKGEEPA
ncbi:MAG: hypothetical protein V2A76_03350 [Planctomycetota bacterium]